MIQAVIFDFDGVIANSEPLHFAAFRDVLADEGIPFAEAEYYSTYLGYADLDLFRALARARTIGWSAEAIAALAGKKAVRLEDLERQGSVLFPGAESAVERLHHAYPLAIASGALKPEILRVLNGANLRSRFHAIVGAEDTPRSKPAPDPYLLAVKLLSSALGRTLAGDECVAVEDSRWGLESARAAGLRTIAVTHTYHGSSLGPADRVIENLHALTVEAISEIRID